MDLYTVGPSENPLIRVDPGRLTGTRRDRSRQEPENRCDGSSERCIGSQVERLFFI